MSVLHRSDASAVDGVAVHVLALHALPRYKLT